MKYVLDLNITEDNISDNIKVSVIDIVEINDKLEKYLNEHFVSICEGNSDGSLLRLKKHVLSFLKGKDSKKVMGAIAEFFVHLYMKSKGYKQECLFLNLEEGSIKKGFDGYYSVDGEEWLMESKSGSFDTKGITHVNKVKEAMNDITAKIEGVNNKNNPWKNAYNHASHTDVGTASNIRNNIKKLRDEYDDGIFHQVDIFNIIPCGTIFLVGKWIDQNHIQIIEDIKNDKNKLKGNKIHVICITQKSVDLFIEYLKK